MTKASMIEIIKSKEQRAWKLLNALEPVLDKESKLLIMCRSEWSILRDLMDQLEIKKEYGITED